ncbi:MAG: triphosphoribosyl-dephospho-CoA synthase [Anaerolineae bacterium]|jgi:triphosphoribosyl-dephospho-CoA synthase|nr:triphosphoribosyl-dephospho-CoA synthase [Anaerolineae bacterium]MDH7475614.1 triphosphoribosyl-dephospho-CoA synthase [Anaerolineae bacterium]
MYDCCVVNLRTDEKILTPDEVVQAAQIACLIEVSASKPGNVSRLYDFRDMRLEDFLLSAAAIGPAIRQAGQVSVGETILRAIQDTKRLVQANTNLGIVLLLAPLARAAMGPGSGTLRERLSVVLSELTVNDARLAYRAIRLASPGGLGRVERGDVWAEPDVTLRQAMALAADRDAVAREYVTDYAITFEQTVPVLYDCLHTCPSVTDATVQTALTLLTRVPDTLIVRKLGWDAAVEVSRQAGEVLRQGGVLTERGRASLARFDSSLRDATNKLNPGTTADLVTTALFVLLLEYGLSVLLS